ncbi:alpha/beta hydrolase-fold protein [Cognatilysobacter tabacisoli]|uniref:alpha/beta hydrolase-fold protein n=1 Tax=Cognatilysobacter tabacisoli TaxID=2315424 RepID=UPI0013008194|nr:alpha/beta hydrolase-fold protein [Lysobacter tabacisoli]
MHAAPRRSLLSSACVAAFAALLAGCAHVAPSDAPAPGAMPAASPTATYTAESIAFPATAFAPDGMTATVLLPPGYAAGDARHATLYVNDGQDRDAVALADTLDRLARDGTIRAPIVVAIDMPADRLGAYGLSDRAAARSLVANTRHGAVGTHAHAYSEWVATTLVPAIDARYRTRATADARAVLGWSLGGLNAFNLGWQYREVFGRVGSFSPSLWLPADSSTPEAAQRTRLAHGQLARATPANGPRLFVAVGTTEETDDRDRDGINDALDDVREFVLGDVAGDTVRAKGLRQLGYTVNASHAVRPTRADLALYELDGGEHNQATWARMLPVFLRWAYAVRAPAIDATGTVEGWHDVPSRHVAARTVDVWLPPGYADDPTRRYPVLYAHDGQNLFDPAQVWTGADWDVDGWMTRLIAGGDMELAIVVGVSNTPRRLDEYMPRAPVVDAGGLLATGVPGIAPVPAAQLQSDAYLRFLVEELKPFIDATYRTRPGRDDTAVMGSSMGGLISLYAAAQYPQVFGKVAALSTHWPIGDGVTVDWFGRHLPDPRTHRLYFDHGTATLDAGYAPFQRRMDAYLRAAGYVDGENWTTRRFDGAEHTEQAWRARLDAPLRFLFGREGGGR